MSNMRIPDLHAIDESFSKGEQCLASQSYLEAINYYDHCIEQIQRDLKAHIHYKKALCHKHMNEAPRAFVEARKCLKLSPLFAQAYQLIADIHLANNDRYDAIRTYQEALKTIPVTDPLYEQLYREEQRLHIHIDSSNNLPFVRLPYEVLRSIFSHLTLKDKINCANTCKGWRAFFLDLPDTFSSLNYFDKDITVTASVPEDITHKFATNCTTLQLYNSLYHDNSKF